MTAIVKNAGRNRQIYLNIIGNIKKKATSGTDSKAKTLYEDYLRDLCKTSPFAQFLRQTHPPEADRCP